MPSSINQPPSFDRPSPFDEAFDRAMHHARAYLRDLSDRPVGSTMSGHELQERFSAPLPEESCDPATVVDDLVRDVDGGLLAVGSPRFFGWVVGGSVPAALAADLLAVTWDQSPGVHAAGPAGSVVEDVCGKWLLEVLDLPRESSFALVTGCQMAHVTCLAAARHALLAAEGWNVEEQGLFGAPRISVITGALCHGTVKRALRLLGFGTECILTVSCNEDGAINVTDLQDALSECSGPTLAVLQAGEVNTGAFDAFGPCIAAARRHGAWVHVDGAFGLWARASAKHKGLTAGLEEADSWATDGHKWLNVPYDCGYAFVRHREAHFRAFSHKAEYLMQSTDFRDPVDWNPEHSKRARGFATYAALKSLGRKGVDDLVARLCQRAQDFIDQAAKLPGVKVVASPVINQGLLRFLDEKPGAIRADSDRRTLAVIEAIERSGIALFTSTHFRGKVCMRVSVSNWQTSPEDIDRVIEVLRGILEEH